MATEDTIVIQGDDYIISPVSDSLSQFNLKLLKSKKNGESSFEDAGFGMSLKRCIEKIIAKRMVRKEPYKDLNEFLSEFIRIKESIKLPL